MTMEMEKPAMTRSLSEKYAMSGSSHGWMLQNWVNKYY